MAFVMVLFYERKSENVLEQDCQKNGYYA